MGVAQGVHEVARRQVGLLRDHHGEQRVGRDVERHAEEDVGAALVELAGQPPVRDVELEHRVARWQRHLVDLGDVPRRDDVPAAVGVGAQRVDDAGDLVDVPAVRRRPGPPLVPVDRPEVTLLVGPLVPDADAALVQPGDVGVAAQEPEQLADDRAQVQPLGGEHGEAGREVEAHLVAEDAAGAGAGAVGLVHAGGEHVVEQVEILLHEAPP
ncbi:hypothetical protein GCM10025862_21730 [Arsenicicoccus piscis]|uniref:Uncharacterized protein n=1 Tax=Arsenicicoccus piscis TaxID=673954 RepID=A0ABQ6HPR0_9MICO|nr:hypothetical protein GCM10025862_21730 [Arsenicicoccus piscis]